MEGNNKNKNEQLLHLMKNHTLDFSELLALRSRSDFFYIIDLETYNLHLISMLDPGMLHSSWRDYKGKKCYAVLQNRDTPCPFCTNHLLSDERYYIWEHFNEVVGRDYILKDKRIQWEGRPARLEIVSDITDNERAKEVLIQAMTQQNLIMNWVQALGTAHTVEEGIDKVLGAVCQYYEADYGIIHLFSENELIKFNSKGNLPFFVISDPTEEMRNEWQSILRENRQTVVLDAESLRDRDPKNYEFMKFNDVQSICITPICDGPQLIGIQCIVNFHKNKLEISLLKMLSACLSLPAQRKILREKNYKIQFQDKLTSSLNYEGFKLKVQEILKADKTRGYSIWYCDIKNFKYINDIYGYDLGDRLLIYWADIVRNKLGANGVFCRASADHIYILLPCQEIERLEEDFKGYVKKMAAFEELVKKKFIVELACGIYLIGPEDKLSVGEMLNRANIAQKEGKSEPGSQMRLFTEEMWEKMAREMELISGMKDALKNEEFLLYLQPQISIQDIPDPVICAEVLVRWKRENEEDIILPGEFIHVFERNGMIVELDHYILEHACKYWSYLQQKGNSQVRLSVNVSRITMMQQDFVDDYCRIKEQYDIKDGCIELEFTEGIAVENVERFTDLIITLQKHGFLCAMDDFGTGHSSLNVLQRLPLDVLKLDRQFFYGSNSEERSVTIISYVLQMAQALGMETIAEGIELQEQVEALKQMGCDYIQGYIFSKPLPAEEFEERMC